MMKYALNASDIKKANRRLVLDAIFNAGTTCRTQLAKDLSLSKPAISDNLETLLQLGIVDEIGESDAGPAGGRRSILLQFNPFHKYIVSINLNFSNPVFVLGNLNGEILNSFDVFIAGGTPIASCMDLVTSGIRVLLQSLGNHADKVYCIAVAAPGVYDEDGKLLSFNKDCGGPEWWKLNLKEELGSAFGLPVIVYNDIKAAALGEWVKGSGSREPNLIYLSAGLGIGAGIILNGALFRGERFNAGEIFDYTDSATVDGITYEDTICIEFLKAQCRGLPAFAASGEHAPSLDAIVQAYFQKDADVMRIVDGICHRLAIITYNFMNFISVSHIVFGGEYAPFGDCYAKHLAQLFVNKPRPAPTIKITSLSKFAGIQGMFYLARQQYFRGICSR